MYQGTTATSAIRIGQSDEVLVAIDGSDAFSGAGDVFQVLNDLEAALAADDAAAVGGTIDRLDAARAQLVSTRSRARVPPGPGGRCARGVGEPLDAARRAVVDGGGGGIRWRRLQFAALQTSYEAALQIAATGSSSKLFDFMR